MSGYLSVNEVDAIRALGAVSVVRGDHSTGVGMAYKLRRKKGNGPSIFSVLKDTIDPYGMLYHPDFNKFLGSIASPQCIIGHCRQATVGSITVENAHPYEFENIIGAHNGTISKFSNKDKETTDSYHLYSLINEHGIETTIKEHMPVEGAYALTWFDKKANTLNMLRNNMRPLWLASAAGGNTIFWASDPAILAVVNRHENITFTDVAEIPPNELHTWNIGFPRSLKRSSLSVPEPTKKEYIPFSNGFFSRRDNTNNDDTCVHTPRLEGKTRPSEMKQFSVLAAELRKKSEDLDTEDEKASPFVQRVLLPPPNTTEKNTSRESTESLMTPTYGPGGNHNVRRRFPFIDTCNEQSIDSAVYLYGANVGADQYPEMITMGQNTTSIGVTKHLRYLHPDGSFMPIVLLRHLLNKGCTSSGLIPFLGDSVFWLNETEFVLKECVDTFHKEYSLYKKKPFGRFVYAPLRIIMATNKAIHGEAKND